MKKIPVIFLLLGFFLTGPVFASRPIVNDPLKIAVGPRFLGMGRACVALVDDVNAIFVNPAGLIQINSFQMTAMRANFLNDYTYTLVGVALPLPFGAVGLGYVSNFAEGAPKTVYSDGHIIPAPDGAVFGGNDDCALASLAIGFKPWIALGANFKYYKQAVDAYGRSGQGVDISALVKLSYIVNTFRDLKPFEDITLGLTFSNIMKPRLKWSFDSDVQEIPTRLRMGISARLYDVLTLTADYNIGGRSTLHAGMEWWVSDQVAIRLGADEGLSNFTLGVGLKTGGTAEKKTLGGHDFEFDYAYRRFESPLDGDGGHFFALSYLGPIKVVKKEFVAGVIPIEEKKELASKQIDFYGTEAERKPKINETFNFYGVDKTMLLSQLDQESRGMKKVELKINYWPEKVWRGQRFTIKLKVPEGIEINKIKVEFKTGESFELAKTKNSGEYLGVYVIPRTWKPGEYQAAINVIAANGFFEPKTINFKVL